MHLLVSDCYACLAGQPVARFLLFCIVGSWKAGRWLRTRAGALHEKQPESDAIECRISRIVPGFVANRYQRLTLWVGVVNRSTFTSAQIYRRGLATHAYGSR